jgi:RND family efflux transporter MFP subunit
MKRLPLYLMTLLLVTLAGCAKEHQQAPVAGPAEVDVASPLKQRITEWDDFSGRFEATQRVDIRARVTGYLMEKSFRDGQLVQKDDVLFVIDPRPFEYEMQRANAQFTLAEKTFNRAKGLLQSNSISQEMFDQRSQEFTAAQAALNEARLNLEFTQIKTPVAGRISDAFVDIGNLVSANETLLTRVVSVDPIHFEFEASQSELLKYLRLDRAGKRPSSVSSPNPIFIKLLDEDTFSHKGHMDFVDNVIDENTGTVKGRALVDNKDGIIFPGLFGRARLIASGEYEAILLPEKAINTDQNRKFVYTVDDKDRAKRVYIKPGPVLDNGFVIIREGLSGNERVIINGTQRIRSPEQVVTPQEITLVWTPIETMLDINSTATPIPDDPNAVTPPSDANRTDAE